MKGKESCSTPGCPKLPESEKFQQPLDRKLGRVEDEIRCITRCLLSGGTYSGRRDGGSDSGHESVAFGPV